MKYRFARICALLGSTAIAAGGAANAQTPSSPNVTMYHNDSARSGLYIMPTLTRARAATAHLEPTFKAIPGAGVNCPPPPLLNVGLTMLKVVASPAPATPVAWCASLASSGAPIVTTTDGKSDPIVWIVGSEGDELLHGYAGDTGKTVFAGGGPASQMARLRRFATILPAENRLYVVGDTRVYAFSFDPEASTLPAVGATHASIN